MERFSNLWLTSFSTNFNEKYFINKHKTESAISSGIFDSLHTTRLVNVCVDRCVSDFTSPTLSKEEALCSKKCYAAVKDFIEDYEFKFLN